MGSLKHTFANFTFQIKRWLTVRKDLFHRWRRTYSDCCTKNLSPFPRMWAFRMRRITGCTYMSNATGSKNGARYIYPSRAYEILPVFGMVRFSQSLVFYSMFCVLLFYVLSWSYQFVFDLPLRFCYLFFKLISKWQQAQTEERVLNK